MTIYSAKEAFTFDQNGIPRFFTQGDLISSDDPGFAGREHLFEPVETAAARASATTETATADPGERRVRTRGRSKNHETPEGDN